MSESPISGSDEVRTLDQIPLGTLAHTVDKLRTEASGGKCEGDYNSNHAIMVWQLANLERIGHPWAHKVMAVLDTHQSHPEQLHLLGKTKLAQLLGRVRTDLWNLCWSHEKQLQSGGENGRSSSVHHDNDGTNVQAA